MGARMALFLNRQARRPGPSRLPGAVDRVRRSRVARTAVAEPVAVPPHQGPAERDGDELGPARQGRAGQLGAGIEADLALVADMVAADVVPDRERLAPLQPRRHVL